MSNPAGTSSAPGWYGDPHSPGSCRYFDGIAWTQHVAPAPGGAFGPAPPATALGAHPSDPMHWLLPTGRTWQSIAAGYVGIFAAFIWFLGPVALGLGVWALRASADNGAHGRGRAIFAIAVGAAASLAALTVLILSTHSFGLGR